MRIDSATGAIVVFVAATLLIVQVCVCMCMCCMYACMYVCMCVCVCVYVGADD